jgi:hypothetical protein
MVNMQADRYRTALAIIVRSDINRTLIAAGRTPTNTDRLHADDLNYDWRAITRYRPAVERASR